MPVSWVVSSLATRGAGRPMVTRWRNRFAALRLNGLADEPRSGRARLITDEEVEAVIAKTLEERPKDATHWSTRSMADALGMSQSSISRIWPAFGLQPHREETFAVRKAGGRAHGAAAASDAVLTFRDAAEVLAEAGVTALVQPGGSRLGDAPVIVLAQGAGLAIVFTSRRQFKQASRSCRTAPSHQHEPRPPPSRRQWVPTGGPM
jgi:transposase